jgi:hypothetical protein
MAAAMPTAGAVAAPSVGVEPGAEPVASEPSEPSESLSESSPPLVGVGMTMVVLWCMAVLWPIEAEV